MKIYFYIGLVIAVIFTHLFFYNNGYDNGYRDRLVEIGKQESQIKIEKEHSFEQLPQEINDDRKKITPGDECETFIKLHIPDNCLLITSDFSDK